MSKPSPAWFLLVLAVTLLVLVHSGHLSNGLIFDDARLTDGTVFGTYGHFDELRARWLSYGSFVWIQGLAGEGWRVQRAVNLALHIGTGVALYIWLHQLFSSVLPESDEAKVRMALCVGLALWAVNPVSSYAVGYLIQRSVLMATLFVALALWCTTRAFAMNNPLWLLGALTAFVLALLSKEHAITSVLLVPIIYLLVKRPGVAQVTRVFAFALVLLGLAAWALWQRYGGIVGTVFDETSIAYMQQLELIAPGTSNQIYLLSLVNQAWLFFQYGLLWAAPLPEFLSLDLRPSFPLSVFGIPQFLGPLAYAATLILGVWLMLKKSGLLALFGALLLVPALLFLTEFSTVWVQDPFVLYRSYLWSIAMPGLIAITLLSIDWTGKYVVGVAALFVLALSAGLLERLGTLRDARSAWQDAVDKLDLTAPPNAVGRWRPMLNLASEELERGNDEKALRLYQSAVRLGEPLGSANFGLGIAFQQKKQHAQALAALEAAEKQGFSEAALHYHLGESYYAIGKFNEAFDRFKLAAAKPQAATSLRFSQQRQAEAAIATQQYGIAADIFKSLLTDDPRNTRYTVGLSMALIGLKNYAAALQTITPTLQSKPTPQALYVRALIYFHQGESGNAKKDLQIALAAEPQNPAFLNLQRQLSRP